MDKLHHGPTMKYYRWMKNDPTTDSHHCRDESQKHNDGRKKPDTRKYPWGSENRQTHL